MSIYGLFASKTATEASAASFDVQFDGNIVAWNICSDASGWDATNEGYAIEVSFGSSGTFTTNDARSTIAMGRWLGALSTNGAVRTDINNSCSGLLIPVSAGERIHLHMIVSTGLTVTANVAIYVEDGASTGLRRRR